MTDEYQEGAETLIRSARDSDFEIFVRESYPPLLRLARAMCGGDRSSAQDLLQNAMLKTYLNWKRIRDYDKARAYIRTVMIRTLISDRRRAWINEVPDTEATADRTCDGNIDELVSRLDILAALRSLPRRQSLAITLRYYVGLSEAETARELSCTVTAVKSLTARALVAMRDSSLPDVVLGDRDGQVRESAPNIG